MLDDDRRWVRMYVSPRSLVHWMTVPSVRHNDPLPKDTTLVNCAWSDEKLCWCLTLRSIEFHPVPEGGDIRIIEGPSLKRLPPE